MMETFDLVHDTRLSGTLSFTGAATSALGTSRPDRLVIAHGTRRVYVRVQYVPGDRRTLSVASDTAQALGLVSGVPYQLRRVGGELHIGPVIGILVDRAALGSALVAGAFLPHHLLRYATTGGLVYVFSAEGVDPTTETIEGLYWRPGEPGSAQLVRERRLMQDRRPARRSRAVAAAEAPKERLLAQCREYRVLAARMLDEVSPRSPDSWEGPANPGEGAFVAGRFAYPAALCIRSAHDASGGLEHLITRMGARAFNAFDFNQETAWEMFSAQAVVRPHLPWTERFSGLDQLLGLVAGHERVIMKPVDGGPGKRLVCVARHADGFSIQDSSSTCRPHVASRMELAERLEPLIGGRRYIVQQVIDLPRYCQRPVDFKVFLHKDDRGRWSVTGGLGRFGRKGAFNTTLAGDAYVVPVEPALMRMFGVRPREAFRMKTELFGFALAVGQVLDESGSCFGSLALEICIDSLRRLWLLEVNNRLPDLETARYLGDPQLYLDTVSMSLSYASHLAGFGRR